MGTVWQNFVQASVPMHRLDKLFVVPQMTPPEAYIVQVQVSQCPSIHLPAMVVLLDKTKIELIRVRYVRSVLLTMILILSNCFSKTDYKQIFLKFY